MRTKRPGDMRRRRAGIGRSTPGAIAPIAALLGALLLLSGCQRGPGAPPARVDDHGDRPATATRLHEGYRVQGNRLVAASADGTLSIEFRVEGTLTAGDFDYFVLTVGQAGTLTARTSGSTDTYGYLEARTDHHRTVLDEDDNSGAGANFRVTARVTAGIYYIGVMGSSITTAGNYELWVTFSATPTPLPTGDRMYWTDQATDKIQRANLDGSVVEDLVSGLGNPEGIAIHDDKIYWADSATDKIQRADLDGSVVEDLVSGLGNPKGIAIHDGKIYWTDSTADRIQRANLDGSVVEDLVSGLASPEGIAIHDGRMYWADSGTDKIQRANLDGSAVEDLVSSLGNPRGLAIHDGRIYWADSATDKIQRANLDGSVVEDLVSGLASPEGVAIHDGKIYWTDSGTERIQRSDLDGSFVEDLVTDLETPGGIAIVTSAEPPLPGPEDDREIVSTYRGHGDEVFQVNPDGESLDDAHYTLHLGNESANVYLIVTNTNEYTAPATIERLDASASATEQRRSFPELGGELQSAAARNDVPRRRRRITESNNYGPLARGGSASRTLLPAVRRNDTHVFYDIDDDGHIVLIPATARVVVDDGAATLAVWVADADWRTSCWQPPPPSCVDSAMAYAVAERFLSPGSGNDIHDWVTTIFGDPWGPHSYDDLIPAEYAEQIHILVFDIGFDGEEGRIGGFFWSKDTVIRDPVSPFDPIRASNERLMFYIDSYHLGRADGPTWEVTDYSPADMMGALAHEFQHMIHFYQKRVRHADGPVSEAWLNEMASLVAEDLVADKLMIHGPRGVAYDDGTAGQPETLRGRLPLYNYHNRLQVTRWYGGLENYAVSYALGAYLARSYGGAPLFREIVRNDKSGIGAIEAAMRAQGHALSFGEVLVNWAVANLLSDDTGAPAPYRYNSGTWSISDVGGETYRLGSINLYNYRYYFDDDHYADGPVFFSFEGFTDGHWQRPHSNVYATLRRNTGSVRLRMSADPGVRITVVVKE